MLFVDLQAFDNPRWIGMPLKLPKKANLERVIYLECFLAYEIRSKWSVQQLFRDVLLSGGARGVMVIVIGNGHGDTSSNPGQD